MSYINKEQAIDLIESMIADKGVAFNPHKLAMALKDMESVEIPEAKDADLISRQAPKRPKRTETIMVDGEPTEIDPLSYEVGYSHGQSERPKGEWVKLPYRETVYACDQCGCEPYYFGNINTINFCSNCGADMRGDKE